jgi:hypothetical protein
MVFNGLLGGADHLERVGINHTDLSIVRVYEHDPGGAVFQDPPELLLAFFHLGLGVTAPVNAVLGEKAEKNQKSDNQNALPCFMRIRIHYLGKEVALLKKNDMDPGFQKPEKQSEADTDQDEIFG